MFMILHVLIIKITLNKYEHSKINLLNDTYDVGSKIGTDLVGAILFAAAVPATIAQTSV